ncbi:MAG: proline--tRNA ligase [Chloroflexi bacterium]|nr:proline--tRNA ligase [Chloroflexota bacterium]
MRFSRLFGKTQRQPPAEADTVSHQLLARCGMIEQIAAGVYAFLPLGWRTLRKIDQIVREEMDEAGGQELFMPTLQPVELWEKTGRHLAFGQTLFTLEDRRNRKIFLGPTHEEIITELVHRQVKSYRDLPLLLYQIQTKFRDEPRPRGGLLRVREFQMKDLYSFDVDEAGLDAAYERMVQAYKNIYTRCGLPHMMVEADSGAIGGKDSHEFMLLAGSGEDEIIYCRQCGYAANLEKAKSRRAHLEGVVPQPLEEVATPGMKTISEVAGFLGVPEKATLKAIFYMCDGELVFVVTRGDVEVNETKLKRVLKCLDLRLAREDEVKLAGIVAGYASLVGLSGIRSVGDESVTMGSNFVAGANKPDCHLKNVNYGRDFKADILTDIGLARGGEGCPGCGADLLSTRGVEVGHVFKLGTFLSERMGAFFLDERGEQRPIVMGCYGIGIGRILAGAVEQNHDDAGIIWPAPIAPYHVYLCPLFMDNAEVVSAAEKLYQELQAAGVEVLFDDRADSPGIKFNDADLLGIPVRVTISPRLLKTNSIEVKKRTEKKAEIRPVEGVVMYLKQWVNEQLAASRTP